MHLPVLSPLLSILFGHQLNLLKHEDYYWKIGFIGLVSAAIIHLLFIPLFLFLDLYVLALVNVFSVATYLYAIYGLGDKALIEHNDKAIGWLVYFELLIHGIFATYYLGLESGFQYYIYILAVLPFFTSYSLKIHILRIAGILITSLFLNIYFRDHVPFGDINRTYIFILGNINLAVFILLGSFLVYLFTKHANSDYHAMVQQSHRDPLTHLYNRSYVTNYVERLLSNKMTAKEQFTLLILDIDYFKTINDTYGHSVGNEVIIKVADLLRQCVDAQAIVSRWGGEEYVILLPEAEISRVRQVAADILNTIRSNPLCIDTHTIYLTLTCGAAIRREDESFISLFIRADKAMYSGKKEGRDCYRLDAA